MAADTDMVEDMEVASNNKAASMATSVEGSTEAALVDVAAEEEWAVEAEVSEEGSRETSAAVETTLAAFKAAREDQSDSKTTHSGTKTSKTSASGRLPLLRAPDKKRLAINIFNYPDLPGPFII